MHANFPLSSADRQLEYSILANSPINWTLVRLPLIHQTVVRKELRVLLHGCPGDSISATDLVHFIVEQLRDDTYCRKAPFIANL